MLHAPQAVLTLLYTYLLNPLWVLAGSLVSPARQASLDLELCVKLFCKKKGRDLAPDRFTAAFVSTFVVEEGS